MTIGIFPEALRDASPTVLNVYTVLIVSEEPLTYDELAEEVGASRRSVKDAILELRDAGIVDSEPDPINPNRKRHSLCV
jgi:DNA-binding transcriptional regulator GbsR (MarR family)